MKKTGLNVHVYDFSVDYDAITVDDILDIRNYLMKKNDIAYMFGLVKKCIFTGFAFSSTLTNINMLSCISMSNQECKGKPQIVNVNSEESVFFSFQY